LSIARSLVHQAGTLDALVDRGYGDVAIPELSGSLSAIIISQAGFRAARPRTPISDFAVDAARLVGEHLDWNTVGTWLHDVALVIHKTITSLQ